MADNFDFTPGTGDVGAADEIGGVKYARVKVNFGADGEATDVSASDPFPIYVISAIPAGTNNIGDVDVASIAAGTNTIGATKDAGTAFTTSLGVSGAAVEDNDVTTPTAITDVPTSGQKIVLDDLYLSTDTDMYVQIEEETSGTVFLGFYLKADSSYQFSPRGKIKAATADKKLMIDSDTAGNVTVTAIYHSEA